jgi:hypothetical protein
MPISKKISELATNPRNSQVVARANTDRTLIPLVEP